jgi:Predicted Zn-dependent peptidases, insulinase-like
MWKQIRGLGHAYSYNMVPRPNEGQLHLTFYRATNVVAAYTEAKNIIVSILTINYCSFVNASFTQHSFYLTKSLLHSFYQLLYLLWQPCHWSLLVYSITYSM